MPLWLQVFLSFSHQQKSPVGQVLKVRVYLAKDGTKSFGWMRNITFVGGPNDGRGYEMWGGGLDEKGNPIQ